MANVYRMFNYGYADSREINIINFLCSYVNQELLFLRKSDTTLKRFQRKYDSITDVIYLNFISDEQTQIKLYDLLDWLIELRSDRFNSMLNRGVFDLPDVSMNDINILIK